MSKQEMRKRLAMLSFSEKVKILEKLRDRSLALSIVRVFLIGGPNDPNPEMRRKLEPEAQKYLSSHLKGGAPNAARAALHALLMAWLVGRGRGVRFELNIDGKVRGKEVTTAEELNNLLGQGQTPATLLRALEAEASSS